MKVLGFYGASDVGKTTLVEKISEAETKKFKLEKTKGITLKVSYASFKSKARDQTYYLLDNPGHASFSIETLRNVDLVDLGIYVFDCSVLKNPDKKKFALDHYAVFSKMFQVLKVPFVVLLNKAELSNYETLYNFYKELSPKADAEAYLPTCCFNEENLLSIHKTLDVVCAAVPQRTRSDPRILLRTIKSFDVNYVGVPLKSIKGGVLGGYYYSNYDSNKSYSINARTKPCYEPVLIENVIRNEKIGSIETLSDPYFFKNDSKKSTYVIDSNYQKEFGFLQSKFVIKVRHCWRVPLKNDMVNVILEGQLFKALVKKANKHQLLLLKKDEELCPLLIPNGFCVVLNLKKNSNEAQDVLSIGNLTNWQSKSTQVNQESL